MNIARVIRASVCAALWLGAQAAWGSGGEAEDIFVSRTNPDAGLERYDRGELGVVLPSYPRLFLYPAWRAIVLGREGLAARPSSADGLAKALARTPDVWVGPEHPMKRWLDATASFVDRPAPAPGTFQSRSPWRNDALNCPHAAFVFALDNLRALSARTDSEPHLREWVRAQDAVFDFCDYNPNPPSYLRTPPKPRPVVPMALPPQTPLYWRQLRDYQTASALFYDGDNEGSAALFERIGSTAGHPMQQWGAYLALRARVRALSEEASSWGTRRTSARFAVRRGRQPPESAQAVNRDYGIWAGKAIDDIVTRADRILANSSLAAVHEPVRATVRTARFRITPREQLIALGEYLNDPARDPHQASALGDWRRLASQFLEDGDSDEALANEAMLRQRFAYADWMRTLQRCAYGDLKRGAAAQACEQERAHAIERWRATRQGERRAWLVAALALADTLPGELETAALQVPSQAPEFLTVRYNLARLYRQAAKPDRAREVAGAVLAGQELVQARSDSARVLFAQERFAAATSLADAAAFLERRTVSTIDRDTGESMPLKEPRVLLAADGLAWTNTRLSVADLLSLSRDARLDATTRSTLLVAAWMRADLLEQAAVAEQAARQAQALPALAEFASKYLETPQASERHHLLLVAGVRLGLSPDVRNYAPWSGKPPPAIAADAEQPTASMWCHIAPGPDARDDPWNMAVEKVPPPPDLAPDPAVRDAEIARLRRFKSATGYLGDHVMARVKTNPQDPELPWLLHVVVQSTRGGCVDKNNSALSRAAHQVLHSRYKDSPWARKTPYWY